jgi:hypothetical protein
LTSEDTGAYGRDIGTDLPTLLWNLVEVIPEGAMLRLGMTNPPYILEHLEVRKAPHLHADTDTHQPRPSAASGLSHELHLKPLSHLFVVPHYQESIETFKSPSLSIYRICFCFLIII